MNNSMYKVKVSQEYIDWYASENGIHTPLTTDDVLWVDPTILGNSYFKIETYRTYTEDMGVSQTIPCDIVDRMERVNE